jgi:two-component system, chemotaxis family, chemotaxis protein CheY
MNTAFLRRTDAQLNPLRLPADVADDDSAKYLDRWDTVFRRLSHLEPGNSQQPGDTGSALRQGELPSPNGIRRLWKRVRYVLIDRSGPLGEFETWDDAFQFMEANHVNGGSIVRSDRPIGERAGQSGTGQTSMISRLTTTAPTRNQSSGNASKKVLVIEDEVFTLLSMTQMVKGAGHNVVIARDAAEGVDAIRLERPDLILTDINLTTAGQGWDGFGVIEWMNFHYPGNRTKCIVVSGGDYEKLKTRANALGALAFLRKPLEKDVLLGEIRRAIGEPSELLCEAPK